MWNHYGPVTTTKNDELFGSWFLHCHWSTVWMWSDSRQHHPAYVFQQLALPWVIIWSTQESNAATALCLTDLLLCWKYLGLMVLTRIECLRYLVADLSVAWKGPKHWAGVSHQVKQMNAAVSFSKLPWQHLHLWNESVKLGGAINWAMPAWYVLVMILVHFWNELSHPIRLLLSWVVSSMWVWFEMNPRWYARWPSVLATRLLCLMLSYI